jgi:predicted transcriptional regulator
MPRIYLIKSPIVSSFSSNLSVKVLELMPWVVTRESKVKEGLQRMQDEGVHTLMVIDKNGKVLGLVTEDSEVAVFGKKKKRTGTKGLDKCWENCQRKCANEGGCKFVAVDYDEKGRFSCTVLACNNELTDTLTFESVF